MQNVSNKPLPTRSARPSGRPRAWAALFLLALLGAATPLHARTLRVKPAGPGFAPLQDALEKARHGDVVVVEPGTYAERIELPSGVTLRSTAGPGATILRGDGVGSVVLVRDADTLTALEGFTVIGGGAMEVPDWGATGGGAVASIRSDVRIRYCVFRANRLPGKKDVGGAIAIFGGHVVVENNRFEGNSASRGGAIFVKGVARITGNVFEGNRCTRHGGAILVEKGNAGIERNIFKNNYAGWGAGVCVSHLTKVTIRRNTFVSNHAHQWGGAMFVYDSEPVVERNLLVDNLSDYQGGGFVSGKFAYPVVRNNLGFNNKPVNFVFREDTLDLRGYSQQLVADPLLDSAWKGDYRPRFGGPAAGRNGIIGALDPIPQPPQQIRPNLKRR